MSTLAADTPKPSRALHYTLWALQLLLALAYAMAGVMKTTQPIADLGLKMNWVNHVPPGMVRFIGIAELAGALGLVLPAATRIMPGLTSLTAALLTLDMVLAAAFHVYLGEAPMMVPALVLGTLAAIVAWGRFKKAPIAAR